MRAACILEKMLRKELVLAARALAAAPLRAECALDACTVDGAWGVRGRGLRNTVRKIVNFGFAKLISLAHVLSSRHLA